MVAKTVDSYRFLDAASRPAMRHWAHMPRENVIPWRPLKKPLSECTVALISSAGLAMNSDTPFDQEVERRDPWFSDPSYRVLPSHVRTGDVRSFHLHISYTYLEKDLNCVLPAERLELLAAEGIVGAVARSHYSYIGYTTRPERLLKESVPAIVKQLRQEQVDAVLLVPV